MFDFKIVTDWFTGLLNDGFSALGLSEPWVAGLVLFVQCLVVSIVFLTAYALLAMALIYMERKVCAAFQCRRGPNRVGPWGLFQVVADTIKMLIKEIIHIDRVDKFLFALAPFLVIMASMLAFAAIPFGKGLHAVDFNIGVFYIIAVSSLGVLGILLAGWASNNKYTMIGAIRSGLQMVSYELSVGLSLLTMVILAGTMSLSGIIDAQADGWFIFKGHIPAVIAFVIYMMAGHAETNRGPFDLPEAESELTAGYHTEYSGIHFGFFYLAEYLNMFIIGAIGATVFLGGWQPLYISGFDAFNGWMAYIPSVVWFFGKAFFCVFLQLWVRWTFPRLRVDQLLKLEWKYLLPLNLLNIMLMALIVVLGWYF